MVDWKQNQSYTNFVMLTENLYELFIQYIIGGRLRAPPESDLVDMKSTFQKGAKTDRRALQSKFKSWAKRMLVDQNKLKLSFSGKEIIPQERCGDIVMNLHSEGHKSIDIVISKVQERYTWTKKNFGMDRDMVLNLILENCPSLDCRQQIEKEMSKRNCCENFIKSVILASEAHLKKVPENQNPLAPLSINDQMFLNSSSIYAWPMVLPFPNTTTSKEYLFPYQCSNDNIGTKSTQNTSIENERQFFSANTFQKNLNYDTKPNFQELNKYYKVLPVIKTEEKSTIKKNSVPSKSLRTCRKPKNINDFKNLLKIAEEESGCYPPILSHRKTKFLGSLELVPKRICSKKTLITFEQEKKRKKKFEKLRLMSIMRRKNLRDRNKLYKIKMKQQQDKRAYLGIATPKKMLLPQSEDSFIENSMCDSWQQGTDGSFYKDKCGYTPKKEIEVINISSSDEETCDYHDNIVPDNRIKQESTEAKHFGSCYSSERENFQRFKSSSISELKRKETILSQYFQSNPEDLKILTRTLESSFNRPADTTNMTEIMNPYVPNTISQPPNTKAYLIPANIKGEVAVIPPSRFYPIKPMKSFPVLNMKETGDNHFSQVKSEFSSFKPIPKVLGPKRDNFQEHSHLLPQLPKDTSTFLVEKTPSGVFTMIPFTSSNMVEVMTSQNSVATEGIKISQKNFTPTSSDKHQWKSFPSAKNYFELNPLQELNMNKRSINDAMSKLSTFINKMKSDMAQVMFRHNIERSAQRMEAQLNAGIALVRNIRKKLHQIEKLERLSRIIESENLQNEL